MAKPYEQYQSTVVESYESGRSSGLRGSVRIRPLANQGFSTDLAVECSRALIDGYPIGTRFRIRVKLTDRFGSGEFLYSSYRWPFDVVERNPVKDSQ